MYTNRMKRWIRFSTSSSLQYKNYEWFNSFCCVCAFVVGIEWPFESRMFHLNCAKAMLKKKNGFDAFNLIGSLWFIIFFILECTGSETKFFIFAWRVCTLHSAHCAFMFPLTLSHLILLILSIISFCNNIFLFYICIFFPGYIIIYI